MRQVRLHLLHVGVEPHRQHPVGLVEDQHGEVVERERPAQQMVEGASRRGDHQMRARLERVDLRSVADAAVDGDRPETAVPPQHLGVALHLPRELAGRHQHERLRAIGRRVEPLQHRQQERGRLARSPCAPGSRGRAPASRYGIAWLWTGISEVQPGRATASLSRSGSWSIETSGRESCGSSRVGWSAVGVGVVNGCPFGTACTRLRTASILRGIAGVDPAHARKAGPTPSVPARHRSHHSLADSCRGAGLLPLFAEVRLFTMTFSI